MDIDPLEIKLHIKKHYSGAGAWRESFKSKKSDSLISKMINFLKRRELRIVTKIVVASCNQQYSNFRSMRILDAGCGNGEYSLVLAKKFPHAIIYALDFSEEMCLLTKKRAQEAGLSNIRVYQGDIDQLNFAVDYFDFVLCIDTLHHIPDVALGKSLSELQRVTKKGALMLVDFKNRQNPFLYYFHRKKNKITYYFTNRTYNQMKHFLQKAGLNLFKAKGVGFPLRQLAPYVVLVGCKD